MSKQSTRRKSNDLSELRSDPEYKKLLKDIKSLLKKSQLFEQAFPNKKINSK